MKVARCLLLLFGVWLIAAAMTDPRQGAAVVKLGLGAAFLTIYEFAGQRRSQKESPEIDPISPRPRPPFAK